MSNINIISQGRVHMPDNIKYYSRYHTYLSLKNAWIEEQEELLYKNDQQNSELPPPVFSGDIRRQHMLLGGRDTRTDALVFNLGIVDYFYGTNGNMFSDTHVIITCIYINPKYRQDITTKDVVDYLSEYVPTYVASYNEKVQL